MEDIAARQPLDLAELRMDLETLKARLPRPWKQILGWLTVGETTRQIAKRLHAWEGIGPDRPRCLVRETRAIVADSLRGDGDRLRALIARKEKIKKSRWGSTPPTHRTHVYRWKRLS